MNLRHAAALALVGWYVFTPPLLRAQNNSETLKTFTAPDGAFSFRYWDDLIHCQHEKQGPGEGWSPEENCMAYHPVCDELFRTPGSQTAVACFAYPRNSFTNTPVFEAATFSVEIVDHRATRKSCLTADPDVDEERSETTINGVSFAVFRFEEGGMNQSVEGHAYRTFRNGKCYQLGINQASAVFDPSVREPDWNQVKHTLEQALKSFRFLK